MADYRSSGKELRRSPKGFIAAVLAVGLVFGAGFGVLHILKGVESLENSAPSSEAEFSIPMTSVTDPDPDRVLYTYEAMFASDVHKGPLMLVNKSVKLEEDPAENQLVSVYTEKNERLHVKDTTVMLQKEAMDALNAMAEGFYQETGHSDLLVLSGFRSKVYQKELYDADLKKTGLTTSTLVAEPGCSEHQTGYAFDFSIFSSTSVSGFDGTGDYAWITKHCAEYGFILRYAEDKTSQTGFSAEPWHFRYVGEPHAVYMMQNHLCLEEYMELLEQYTYDGEHLEITDAKGNVYETFLSPLTAEDAAAVVEVPIPANGEDYTCSGNNKNGFIVTVGTGRQSTSAETAPAAE